VNTVHAASTESPDAARLEACLALLLGADTPEEFADAKAKAKRVMAMGDEEVAALGTPEGAAPRTYDRKADAGEPHRCGCLMAVLPARLRDEVTSWARDAIPDDALGSEGYEDRPHITIKYGFRDSGPETVAKLKAMLAGVPPFEVRLGGLASFDGKPGEGDPLYLEVGSDELLRLNAAISRAFPCEDAHPTYVPHVCVAYVDPDFAEDAVGRGSPFAGAVAVVGSVEWSGADGLREVIRLASPRS